MRPHLTLRFQISQLRILLTKLHHARRIDWPDVQRTRVAVVKAYNAAPQTQKAAILKEVVVRSRAQPRARPQADGHRWLVWQVIMLHSVTPPDRVGVRSHALLRARAPTKLRWRAMA